MKAKCILSFLLFLQSVLLLAQEITRYDLSSHVETYVPLSNTTQILTDTSTWINESLAIDTGFEFENLTTTSDGFLTVFGVNDLGGNGVKFNDLSSMVPLIRPLSEKFQNRAQIEGNPPSQILYKTEGEPGNRIFKLEYANAGFYIEELLRESLDMFTSVQLWIYENSSCVEIRFGPSNLSIEEDVFQGRPWISLGLLVTTLDDFSFEKFNYVIFAQGDPQNPTQFERKEFWLGQPIVIPIELSHYLYSFPPNGMVYTFCPEGVAPPTSTFDLDSQVNWELFPNPVKDNLTIDFNESLEANYEILTIGGRVLIQGTINNEQQSINVQSLTQGLYITKIRTSNGVSVKRFFKIK